MESTNKYISYEYKVGGSLAFNHPTYVERIADRQLLQTLKAGKFCYVFNCRQMGKSSLRVKAMHQLQAEGMSCASIDITSLGSDLSQAQWYGGIITQLFLGFNLVGKVNLKTWLKEREELSSVQKLSRFFEEVLLVHCTGEKIFIFIDEIDKVLSLKFSLDDFFSLIRFCYNQRAENTNYDRLTFALFGVATPSDLIRDKVQTPFNIGQAIELTGFSDREVEALAPGLPVSSAVSQIVLAEILQWTGGQPFLTQKLCQLLLESQITLVRGGEKETIERLVRSKIIENWESQDEPVHLKTIRDRLLRNEQRAGRLLGIYQQILQQGAIAVDDTPEQSELLLSGLVVKREGKLTIYNRIYRSVFNQNWVEKQLQNLRPYSEAIVAWETSNYQDDSRLLRGQALKDALAWAVGKSLSNLDYQFLTVSQKLDKREAELNLEAERKANKILKDANQKARRRIRIGSAILLVSLLGSTIALRQAQYAFEQQKEAKMGTRLQRIGDSAWQQFQFEQMEALLSVMQAGQDLKQLVKDDRLLQDYPAISPLVNLQQILDNIHERNQLEGHQESVNSVSFSPDGEWIVTASRDGTARVWDKGGREKVKLLGHRGDVYGVTFSPDGQRIATASGDGTVKLWDLTGRTLTTLSGHENSVYSVAFSPDGKYLATASRDNTTRIWDLEGKTLAILQGHEKSIDDVAFSPDGKRLATASRDGTIRLWNLQGRQLRLLGDGSVPFYSVSFSPDGKYLATASRDNTAKLWDLQGNVVLTLKTHQDLVNSVNFSADGKWLATASSDGTAKVWNLQGKTLATLKGHQEPVYDVAFSPKGKQIATASSDGTVKLWDLTPKPITRFRNSDDSITSVNFSPDRQSIAIASEDGTVSVWDFQGHLLHRFEVGSDLIYGMSFSQDGQSLATASSSGVTKLWNLQGKQLAELGGNGIPAYSVSFSREGHLLAIAYRDGTVEVWNRQGDRLSQISSFEAHRESIYNVDFSPNRQMLATASSDGTVKLWDERGNLLGELRGHQDLVYQVTFSRDGDRIATASRDGSAKVWNLQGELLTELKGDPFPVYRVSFSPDGQLIAVASRDGTVRLWDLSGNLRSEFKGNPEEIYGISFSDNERQVASVSKDGAVRMWQVETESVRLERLLRQGCQWLGDYLGDHPQEREKLSVCQQL